MRPAQGSLSYPRPTGRAHPAAIPPLDGPMVERTAIRAEGTAPAGLRAGYLRRPGHGRRKGPSGSTPHTRGGKAHGQARHL